MDTASEKDKVAKDQSDDEVLRDRGFRPEYSGMFICPTCYELYETESVEGLVQRCSCRSGEAEPQWPKYDFNQKALLCRCCGLHVLRNGSQWSPFFCTECQLMAMGVSVWYQRLIFPTGRHSLMHTWVPKATSPTLATYGGSTHDLAEGVATTIQLIANATNGLWLWYREIMPRNLELLEFNGAIDLRTYVLAIVRKELGLSTRIKAFDGMCEFFRTVPTNKRRN